MGWLCPICDGLFGLAELVCLLARLVRVRALVHGVHGSVRVQYTWDRGHSVDTAYAQNNPLFRREVLEGSTGAGGGGAVYRSAVEEGGKAARSKGGRGTLGEAECACGRGHMAKASEDSLPRRAAPRRIRLRAAPNGGGGCAGKNAVPRKDIGSVVGGSHDKGLLQKQIEEGMEDIGSGGREGMLPGVLGVG